MLRGVSICVTVPRSPAATASVYGSDAPWQRSSSHSLLMQYGRQGCFSMFIHSLIVSSHRQASFVGADESNGLVGTGVLNSPRAMAL